MYTLLFMYHIGVSGGLTKHSEVRTYPPVNIVVGSCGKRFQCKATGRFTSRDNNPSKRSRAVQTPSETPLRPVRALTSSESVLISETMTRSVKSGTHKDYISGWQIWEDFAERHGFDVFLRGYDHTGRVGAACLFVATTSVGDRESVTRVINTVIRSMKFFFDLNLVGSEFLDDAAILRSRRSVAPQGRSAFDQRTSVERQAATLDMLQWARLKCVTESTTVENSMAYIGFALAYNFMWRASEYIVSSRKSQSNTGVADCVHALKRGDVACYDASGKEISVAAIHECKNISDVNSVTFVIKSSKADQGGQGRFLSLTREGTLQSQLVDDFVSFLRASKTSSNDYLMSRWKLGKNLKLTRKVLTSLLKAAAEAKGLPGTSFALHSLRIGGATQMAASSSDSGMIDRVGGWASGKSMNKSARYKRSTVLDYGALGSIDKGGGRSVVASTDIRKMVRMSKR